MGTSLTWRDLFFIVFITVLASVVALFFLPNQPNEADKMLEKCQLIKVDKSEKKSYFSCNKVEYIINTIPTKKENHDDIQRQ